MKRVFLIILDSLGIGALPDAADFGDLGSNTLKACADSGALVVPNLTRLGLFNIEGVDCGAPVKAPSGCFARMAERSVGKDTTIGHWEIAGCYSPKPLPTYPDGFPAQIIAEFEQKTGRKTLCNKPYSGTKVIEDFGNEHIKTGALIVYTSADSVFQIAAHESVVPLEQLYKYCRIARNILQGDYGVGRVIARPFTGAAPDFTRTSNRHDFSLEPPCETMCDILKTAGHQVIGVGKIYDIFAGRGITKSIKTKDNRQGMEQTIALAQERFDGLVFVNLVDFDMLFGHRNDVAGYTKALCEFDKQLGQLMGAISHEDLVILTADHGCDPATPSTDHSREYVPMLAFGGNIKQGVDLGTRESFADIGATVLQRFGIENSLSGQGLFGQLTIDN